MEIIKQNGGTAKYGQCERCKKTNCEIYHVFERDNGAPGAFVCIECTKKMR